MSFKAEASEKRQKTAFFSPFATPLQRNATLCSSFDRFRLRLNKTNKKKSYNNKKPKSGI